MELNKYIFTLLAIIISFAILNFQTFAHPNVEMTIPDNESIVTEMPKTIVLRMAKKIILTKVEMKYENHKITELDISNYKSFKTEFILPIPPIGNGVYNIFWRAIGQDGHPIKGEFRFTVAE